MDIFDLVVLGGGPGGYVAAIRAAQLGFKVLLVDNKPYLGGTCLNVGCIPSKTLLHGSMEIDLLNHLDELKDKPSAQRFESLQELKNKVVMTLGKGIESLIQRKRVKYVQGLGELISPSQVKVDEQIFHTKKVLLATGSIPFELPFLPYDQPNVLSSSHALSLEKVPKSLAVIGAGVIGLELATVYRRLGCDVTIFELSSRVCPFLDKDISQVLKRVLEKQGLQFELGVKIHGGKATKKTVNLFVQGPDKENSYDFDKVLVAIGRRPNICGFNPEKLGIDLDERGRVKVNRCFQTSCDGVYAIGDLVDGPMLAHKASEEGVAAVEIMAGLHSYIHYIQIPNVIYTSPEIAYVGLSEGEARERGLNVIVGQCPLKANSRARCNGELEGLVKVIAEEKSHRIVGLHIMASTASEMISIGSFCLQKEGTLEDLAHLPLAHPTVSESLKEAALSALGRPLHL